MAKEVDHGRKLPLCLRKYARGHFECNGQPRAKSTRDRMPCVYRDRCVALQHLMKVEGWGAREVLKLRRIKDVDGRRRVYAFAVGDSDLFQRRLVRAIDRYGIRNGRITVVHPKERIPRRRRKTRIRSEESKAKSIKVLARARREATKAIRRKSADDLAETRRLFDWFIDRLQKKAKVRVADSEDTAKIGDLFVIDRIKPPQYSYLKVYIKTVKVDKNGKKIKARRPIVCVYLLVSTHCLQFRFTMEPDDLKKLMSRSSMAKVQFVPFNSGRFKCKTLSLSREGVSIVAEVIAKAIKRRVIKLPRTVGNQ